MRNIKRHLQVPLRGPDFIKQRLLEAKRRGWLSPESSGLAEWFINQNPDLVHDLGISIKSSKGDYSTSGFYNNVTNVIHLIKGNDNPETVVHEILHSTEQLMPTRIRAGILDSYYKDLKAAYKKALSDPEDYDIVNYFRSILD